jgi:hypothetical protein
MLSIKGLAAHFGMVISRSRLLRQRKVVCVINIVGPGRTRVEPPKLLQFNVECGFRSAAEPCNADKVITEDQLFLLEM